MQQNPSHQRSDPNFTDRLDQTTHLWRWFFRAAGFLLPTVIVAGLLGGTVARLKAQQEDLRDQIRALQAIKPGQEQVQDIRSEISRLSQQVESLNQQVPQNLTSQISSVQSRLEALDQQVTQASARANNAVTQEELNQVLQQLQTNQTAPRSSPRP